MIDRRRAPLLARRYIADSRLIRDRMSVLEDVRRAGYLDEEEFWNDFLSESMEALDFIETLAHCLPLTHGDENLWSAIEKSARFDNVSWLRLDKPPGAQIDILWLRLDPRAAATWLLTKPLRRHLVPAGLARVVLGDGKPTPEPARNEKPAGCKRRCGPKPRKRDRVAQEDARGRPAPAK
jgi:hypothetical protein